MRKKTLCLILMFTLLCNAMTTFAAHLFSVDHLLGESYRIVNGEDCVAVDGAIINDDASVNISPGGSATFGFHTPYSLRAVKIVYEGASGTTVVNTLDNEYTLNLTEPSGEYDLVFGENLGIEPQENRINYRDFVKLHEFGYVSEFVEHRGEHEVTVYSTDGMTIKKMIFEKEYVTDNLGADPNIVPDVSTGTSATYSTVMIDVDSPIIYANGGKRFVDYNEVYEKPYVYNGRMYLPINTLAKALGYYHEDYPDKGYALMRSSTHDVILLGGKCYVIEGVSEKKPLDEDVIIYRNGKAYAAVRYFAELIGDTVGYKDGLAVIDNKYTVAEIFNDNDLNKFATDIFKPYKLAAKTGKTYYVAQNHPSASDKASGTIIAPFKTLAQAAEVAQPGDTVIVREGVYRETLKPKNSGTPEARITFKAMEGENVVISATDVVDGWSHYDGDVWTAPMDWDLGATRNQVFIDGKMLNEARYPNGPEVFFDTDKLDNAWAVNGDFYRPGGDENINVVKSPTLLWQKEPDYWKGGYYIGHFGSNYAQMTAKIYGSKEGELTLGDEKTWNFHNNTGKKGFGYIVGHMNALDAPGEWIHEDDTLYMIFPEGATPNQTNVEVKARQLVIDLEGKDYVTVQGFKTIGGSARTNDGHMNILNGLDMKYITHFIHHSHGYRGQIEFPYDITKPGSPDKGEVGIYVGGSDNHVVNCIIDHTAGAGLNLAGLYAYVENNIIHDSYNSNYVSGINIMSNGYEEKNAPRGGHSIYNNTVYNTGRSCLNVSAQGNSHSIFLPMDIAYNDFHDAMLTTGDTGVVYAFAVQSAIDGYSTMLHHNYMYATLEGRDATTIDAYGVYHDAYTYGFDTFNNQYFHTTMESIFKEPTFLQEQTNCPSYARVWGNQLNYVPGGVDALDERYFIEGKMFYAGAMRDTETMQTVEYTKNYDKFINDKFTMEYSVSETLAKNPENISDGVIYDSESGYAKFTADEQYIHFEDIDFLTDSNVIAISTRGDSYNTWDQIEVIVGESIDTGAVYEGKVYLTGYDKNVPERMTVTIDPTSGTKDVWIRVKDYKSLEIGGIYVYKDEYTVADEFDYNGYSAFKWAGEFDDVFSFASCGGVKPKSMSLAEYPGKLLMNQTGPGWIVKYEDVEFTTESDKYVMSAGSGNINKHQPIEVYVEDKNSENITNSNYVAKYIEDSEDWSDRKPQIVDLNKTIEAGTYDVYIKFCEDAPEKTSTVIYFGFFNDKEWPSALLKKIGGDIDESLSVNNEEFPFIIQTMKPPKYENACLTCTLPGTCAVYKDVMIADASKNLIVNYSCDDGFDGQPVDVYLGDPNNGGKKIASFVTKYSGGRLNFCEEVIECTEEIQNGKYEVYFCFGGENEERKTCNLEWFMFTR